MNQGPYEEMSAQISMTLGNARDEIKTLLTQIGRANGEFDENNTSYTIDFGELGIVQNVDPMSLVRPHRCQVVLMVVSFDGTDDEAELEDIVFDTLPASPFKKTAEELAQYEGKVNTFDFNDLSTDDLASVLEALSMVKTLKL